MKKRGKGEGSRSSERVETEEGNGRRRNGERMTVALACTAFGFVRWGKGWDGRLKMKLMVYNFVFTFHFFFSIGEIK